MSSPFKNFDWKNGTITQRHKDYAELWAKNEIEILLSTEPTSEELAKKYLAEICKSANIKYKNVVFVNSPKQLWDSVWASVRASVWASVGASVRDSVGASVGASVWDSVRASVGASVRASVWASVGASVWDSVRDSVWASVGASVWDSVRDSVGAWLDSDLQYYQFYSQEFEKNALEPYCKLLEQITGLLKIGEDIYLVRKPKRLVRNDSGRLHYDHDKAIEWHDGYGFYYLNGVEFDEKTFKNVVEQRVTLETLGKITNADQRAVAVQMLRPDLLLKRVGAKLIHTGISGTELYKVENFMDTGDTEYCMKMEHPSIKGKYYIEWVEPKVGEQGDADYCQAVAFGVPLEDYLNSIKA